MKYSSQGLKVHPDLVSIHEQIWEIRSEAMRLSYKIVHGDVDAVEPILMSIDSRIMEIRRQMHTPAVLMKLTKGEDYE